MSLKQRTPLARFDDVPGDLPHGSVPHDIDLNAVANDALSKLNDLNEDNVLKDFIWRDLLALTGYFRTFYSTTKVLDVWNKLSQQRQRSALRLRDARPRLEKSGEASWVDIDVLFSAKDRDLVANCRGTVSVIPDPTGNWRIWMLRTWLECFNGHGHPDELDPVSTSAIDGTSNGVTHGVHENDSDALGAVVVGGGQSGLSIAGRLHALGVPYVLLEKHADIGDVWSQRYESLRWHTSKEYGNLPFGHTYREEDDYMLPTKRIGAGHKNWSEKYGINVRTRTTAESADWDDASQSWTIHASGPNGKLSIKGKNLVLSIGTGHATPVSPEWASAEKIKASGFKGNIVHAFNGYKSAIQWSGKRGVVVGTANTAHDVAEDMANAGMKTSMLQRNPTFVFPAEWLHAAEDRHYHANMDPADADRETYTQPNKITREIVNRAVWAGVKAQSERFDALEKAGFKLDRFGDIYTNIFVRLGGHYVDIGCSARIAKGEIKVKTEAVKSLTEDGLLFEDGSELGADLIVLCTGFDHIFRNDAARLIGKEAADQMDDFWGIDEEGEIRGHAKPSGREFHANMTLGGHVLTVGRSELILPWG